MRGKALRPVLPGRILLQLPHQHATVVLVVPLVHPSLVACKWGEPALAAVVVCRDLAASNWERAEEAAQQLGMVEMVQVLGLGSSLCNPRLSQSISHRVCTRVKTTLMDNRR
jgi:hypothetical protein